MTAAKTGKTDGDGLFSYLNVAALITLATGSAYLIGRAYFNAFYGVMGFRAATTLLPTTSYVREAIIPLLITIGLLGTSVLTARQSKSIARLTVANASLVVMACLPLPALWVDPYLFIACSALAILLAALAIATTRRKEILASTVGNFLARDVRLGRNGVFAVAAVIVTLVSYFVAIWLGAREASTLRETLVKSRSRVCFVPKTAEFKAFLNARPKVQYALLMEYDQKYFVVAIEPSGVQHPYTISASEVAVVEFECTQNGG